MMDVARLTVVRKFAVLCVLIFMLVATVMIPKVHATSNCFNDTLAARAKGTVALDPGHGGSDPGTSNTVNGTVLLEKEVVLDIALRTKNILIGENYGYRVCLTRIDDANLTNTQRARYANSVGAQVFVLIHLNGSNDKSVNYTSTFWGKRNKDLEFSRHMFQVLQNDLLPGNGGYVGQFASGALLKSNMPATLAESVFLTNNEEAEDLFEETTPGNRRDQIAQALAKGINNWLK